MHRANWRRTRAAAHSVTNNLYLLYDLTRLGAHLVRVRADRWWVEQLDEVEHRRAGEYSFDRETPAQRKARRSRRRTHDYY